MGVVWTFYSPLSFLSSVSLSLGGGAWSGGAMVLGKLPVPGRPTNWMIVGQGPITLSIGAIGWLVGCFGFNGPLSQYFSLYRAVSQRAGEGEEKG